ncbi:MAG: nucleotidyl transferase AbiEii/AbiGii toxin family protein, partial [Clostridium sp.]
ALLTRTAPRDIYDIHNMVRYGLFDEEDQQMLRKCTVYYSAIGAENPPEQFALDNIGRLSAQRIKTDLNPVLRKGEHFELETVQKEVKDHLSAILIPTADEKLFWEKFREGIYLPELIFGKGRELANIRKHPMALWKCQVKENSMAVGISSISKP